MNNIEVDYITKFTNFKHKLVKLTKEDIYKLVTEERNRQDKLFGEQPRHLSIPFWLVIASEEFGEISKAYLDNNPPNLREEIIQTIAVLVAMLEDISYNDQN
jgi:abortive infection bacteriophage resistance protein